MFDEGFDLRFERVERSSEAMLTGKSRIDDRETGTQEPSPCAREEHGDAQTVSGDTKAMDAWDAFDDPVQAKSAQVVRYAVLRLSVNPKRSSPYRPVPSRNSCEHIQNKGFETELTKATRDGGRDIVAIHEVLGIRSKYIIECKRYAAHRKVSLQLVQRLYGVKTAENANKAILATTSSFTRDAQTFASHHVWDLELKSFEDIMAWIRAYPN